MLIVYTNLVQKELEEGMKMANKQINNEKYSNSWIDKWLQIKTGKHFHMQTSASFMDKSQCGIDKFNLS